MANTAQHRRSAKNKSYYALQFYRTTVNKARRIRKAEAQKKK